MALADRRYTQSASHTLDLPDPWHAVLQWLLGKAGLRMKRNFDLSGSGVRVEQDVASCGEDILKINCSQHQDRLLCPRINNYSFLMAIVFAT